MSGAHRSFKTRARQLAEQVTPVTITAGAVTAWLRNATLSGGISSVPNVINPSNPAVQATGGKQPTGNANGSMTFDGGDVLGWTANASNHNTAATGFGLWVKVAAYGANTSVIVVHPDTGAGGWRPFLYIDSGGRLAGNFYSAPNVGRLTYGPPGAVPLNTATYVTVEFNASMSPEAKEWVLTANGVVQTLTFGNAGAASVPSLDTVSGDLLIGAVNAAGTTAANAIGYTGTTSRGIVRFGAMPAATEGLLTPAARTALMNYEPLT